MKNKKLIVTAVAAAIVVSMQASTVFAAEVSDSDLEPTVTQTATEDQAAENEAAEDEVTEDEADEDEVTEDEADEDEVTEDEATEDEADEDEADEDEADEDEADEDEADEDKTTIEDIQALIDQYMEEYKSNPNTDEEDIAEVQAIFDGLLEEITKSERFLNSELTLDDVREYFEITLDSLVFTDEDQEPVTFGQCGDNLMWEFEDATGTLTISGSGDMYDFYEEDYVENWWSDVSSDIQKVVLKGNITSIGSGAFDGLSIETLEIPASVVCISDDAIGDNQNLRSINVAADNQFYASRDGVLFNKSMTELLRYPAAKSDKTYTVPDLVKVIGDSAFSNCRNLTNVTVGNSVTTIEQFAFAQCVRLDEVTLGNSVQRIEFLAFYDSGLTTITLPHWIQSIDYDAFANNALTDVYYLGTEEEWKALKLDGLTAQEGDIYPVFHFIPAERYDEPTLLESSEEEEDFTFDEETLAEIEEAIHEFIEEVKAAEDIDAEQAEKIEEFLTEWLDKVKELGTNGSEMTEEALEDLSGFFEEFFQSIIDYYPDTIETSGRCGDDLTWEFDRETGVLTITGDGDMYDYFEDPNADENAADDVDEEADEEYSVEDMICRLSEDFFSLYIEDDELSNDDEEEEGGIPWLSFSSLITEVKFVGNITSISSSAFMFCDLTTVDIPASVKSIGESAFANNNNLRSINVAEDNEYYRSIDGVLFDKAGEELLLYPPKKADKTYTVPDTVTTIVPYAFEGSRYLTKVVVPASVTAIGEGAFAYCGQLASVKMDGVETIGFGAFLYCYKLKEAEFGSALTSVDAVAFDSTALTQITLPNTLVFLSYDAFDDSDITDVYYLGTEDEWDAIAFYETDEGYSFDEEEEELTAFANAVIHYQPSEEEEPSEQEEPSEEEEPSEQEEPSEEEESSDNPSSGNAVTENESQSNDDSGNSNDTANAANTAKGSKSGSKKPSDGKKSSSHSKNTDKKPSSHKTPSKSGHDKNPKTGEESAVLPLMALIASAFTMAAAFAVSRFRKLRGEEI